MSRDHRNLNVLQDAHRLTVAIYQHTREFSRDEWFGLRAQMRRAAVSIPSNIVEGNARRGTRDYLRFLHIALGSGCELKYLTELARELGYATGPAWSRVSGQCDDVVKQLERLVQRMEQLAEEEHRTRNREP